VKDTVSGYLTISFQPCFSHFHNRTHPLPAKYGGSGLGLIISERLVKLMGGNVWVESRIARDRPLIYHQGKTSQNRRPKNH